MARYLCDISVLRHGHERGGCSGTAKSQGGGLHVSFSYLACVTLRDLVHEGTHACACVCLVTYDCTFVFVMHTHMHGL